ncbi:enoyl-ACP reductase [Burkholderia multivorans]|uniref:enoyl-ACP reductase n=1 Tax=Burkholderia multivorans TaxID=87883 RepID=UPI0021C0A5C6|nr:enoyl-ACP reductase [Burkholderia multivorans]
MERYLIDAMLNAIATNTFGFPIIDHPAAPECTPDTVRIADLVHAMREAFRAGQLTRGRS